MNDNRIVDFNFGDRVKTIDSGEWGFVASWDGEDMVLIDMDSGEQKEVPPTNVLHYHDARFREAIDLVKKHINIHEDHERAKDLHNAIQMLVECHREALKWK